jgi:hypothetical protein
VWDYCPLPVGHSRLNRLVQESDEYEELSSDVGYGVFVMKEVMSTVDEERMYQEQIQLADHRVPEDLKGRRVKFGISPNLSIDLYLEMLDMFQIIPLELNKTIVRASFYGHANPWFSRDRERQAQDANWRVLARFWQF